MRGLELEKVTLVTDGDTNVHGQLENRYLFQKPAHVHYCTLPLNSVPGAAVTRHIPVKHYISGFGDVRNIGKA